MYLSFSENENESREQIYLVDVPVLKTLTGDSLLASLKVSSKEIS